MRVPLPPAASLAATLMLLCTVSALAQPDAPDSEGPARIRAALEAADLGDGLLRVEIRESLFDPDGEFRPGSKNRAKLVDVVFRGAPNLTNGMTARGIELAMVNGYAAIFTAGTAIHQATIEAHMTLVDATGNESLGAVYGTKLAGEAAGRLDWSRPESVRWERVWTVYVMNRAFR